MKYLVVSLLCLTVLTHRQVEVAAEAETAPEGFAPWHVSVQNSGNEVVGGAIIADNYILTAASRLAGLDKSNIKVLTASDLLYDIEAIYIHCNFNKPLYQNDVALLKLKDSIVYDENTTNVALAELDDLKANERLIMTSSKSTGMVPNYPSSLQELITYYISNEECREKFGESGKYIGDGHLCAMPERNNGLSDGLSGGPLVNTEEKLVGIANWATPDNIDVPYAPYFPDIFTRTYFYNDWIRSTMKKGNTFTDY